ISVSEEATVVEGFELRIGPRARGVEDRPASVGIEAVRERGLNVEDLLASRGKRDGNRVLGKRVDGVGGEEAEVGRDRRRPSRQPVFIEPDAVEAELPAIAEVTERF